MFEVFVFLLIALTNVNIHNSAQSEHYEKCISEKTESTFCKEKIEKELLLEKAKIRNMIN